jgi:GntR family transcriptional repressor for pyruvate dehydrogenase complex
VLEVQNAELAAKRATEDAILELEKTLTKMEEVIDDPETFAKHDLEFHVELARATGNELLAVILDPFMDVMYEVVLASNLPDPPEWTLRLHRRIFERVKDGDADGAAEAMASALDQEKPS